MAPSLGIFVVVMRWAAASPLGIFVITSKAGEDVLGRKKLMTVLRPVRLNTGFVGALMRCRLQVFDSELVSNKGIRDLKPVAFRSAAAVVRSHATDHFPRTKARDGVGWPGARFGHLFAEGLAVRASFLLDATHFGGLETAKARKGAMWGRVTELMVGCRTGWDIRVEVLVLGPLAVEGPAFIEDSVASHYFIMLEGRRCSRLSSWCLRA